MLNFQRIHENMYRITGCGCDCYLIDGSEPCLIDCGCCRENIREYAEQVIGKTVDTVICTHSHIDHTENAGYFSHVYMTEKTAATAKNPMDEPPENLMLQYEPEFVVDGQIIAVGKLELQIIECNCHCPGNIMILDTRDNILFTGDEIDRDQVLLLPGFSERQRQYHSSPAATVNDYREMLIRLLPYRPFVQCLCTGHNGSPLPFSAIDEMIALCDEILSGEEGSLDCSSKTYPPEMTHFPSLESNYRRCTRHGYSLVYCADDLYDRSRNSTNAPATRLHRMCEENLRRQKSKHLSDSGTAPVS